VIHYDDSFEIGERKKKKRSIDDQISIIIVIIIIIIIISSSSIKWNVPVFGPPVLHLQY
jgi:hypothetical protein